MRKVIKRVNSLPISKCVVSHFSKKSLAKTLENDWKMFDPFSNEISFPFHPFTIFRKQNEFFRTFSPLMLTDFTENENAYEFHG